MTTQLPFFSATEIADLMPPRAAVAAIEAALASGFDPADDHARSIVPLSHGQLLLMPAETGEHAGIKVASVSPGNPELGLPRIQATYLLFDAVTLAPVAVLDGTAVTTLRTPAVSVAAVRPFLEREPAPLRIVVFGAGPQAVAHVETIAAAVDRVVASVDYVVRRPLQVTAPIHGDAAVAVRAAGDADALIAAADVVVCATTAREPLFDSALLRADAVVIAVGSHEPDARELDSALFARAHVIVEDIDTALREAGDVIQAVDEGAVDVSDLIPMAAVVDGSYDFGAGRPVLFKSSGMSWEDLVIAEAVVAAAG